MRSRFWALLLPLILAACQTSLVTDLTVPSGGILYKDDFLDPTSGWPTLVNTAGIETYSDGGYRIQVNIPQYDLWAVPGQNFQDVRVEADATRLSGPEANRLGLICRYRNPANFYFFIISSDGYYAIGKTLNGTDSLLGQQMMVFSPAIVQGAGPNHFRFDCSGTSLTGYINGQVLASTSDGEFSQGDAGLLAGTFDTSGVQIAFTNFVVIKP